MLCAALLLALGSAPEEEPPDWLDDVESWSPEGESIEPSSPERGRQPEPEPLAASPPPKAAALDEAVVGSLRLVGAYLHFWPDAPRTDDALLATVARVVAKRDLTERIDVELNVFGELSRSPPAALAGSFATAGSFVTPYRAPQLTFDAWNQDGVSAQFGIDRVRLGVHVPRFAFDLGRQPINYAATQIFTPNDFFAPFSATAINKQWKPGVDAARFSFGLGPMASIDVVGVYSPRWERAALLAHANVVRWGFEWAALGGKLAERWIVGASLQGDAGPIGLRAEGHVGFPDRDGDGLDRDENVHVRLAAGPNVNFDWQSATLGAEYAYFSDGVMDPSAYLARFARRFPDDLPYLGAHYVGLVAAMETIPTLRLATTSLVNAGDGSGLVGLSALYSVADQADLLLGGFVPWGRRPALGSVPVLRSEFGPSPLTIFLESRVFF